MKGDISIHDAAIQLARLNDKAKQRVSVKKSRITDHSYVIADEHGSTIARVSLERCHALRKWAADANDKRIRAAERVSEIISGGTEEEKERALQIALFLGFIDKDDVRRVVEKIGAKTVDESTHPSKKGRRDATGFSVAEKTALWVLGIFVFLVVVCVASSLVSGDSSDSGGEKFSDYGICWNNYTKKFYVPRPGQPCGYGNQP